MRSRSRDERRKLSEQLTQKIWLESINATLHMLRNLNSILACCDYCSIGQRHSALQCVAAKSVVHGRRILWSVRKHSLGECFGVKWKKMLHFYRQHVLQRVTSDEINLPR